MDFALPDIRDVDVSGKTIFIRADLNVPMSDGTVTDTTRIDRFAPTVSDLVQRGAKVIVATHVGRPKGEVVPSMSAQPLAKVLAERVGSAVAFTPIDKTSVTDALATADVVMVENLRFNPGEENSDESLASELAGLADLYVNDAFSCSHRAHASMVGITRHLPSYAGPSLMAEVDALKTCLNNPQRPVAALVGGAKVSSKIGVLEFLIDKVDSLIIGGGMANTFLAAQGHDVGKSLCEHDAKDTALAILAKAQAHNCDIILPTDVVVATEFAANAPNQIVAVDAIPEDMMALDVGPETTARIINVLQASKTLLWNGPLGAFEIEPFGAATFEAARAAADLTRSGNLSSVAGGGDTVAALNAAGVTDQFTYVSTAGGAFLEWIEGKELPAIAALRR